MAILSHAFLFFEGVMMPMRLLDAYSIRRLRAIGLVH
jgi:hypothetical protein